MSSPPHSSLHNPLLNSFPSLSQLATTFEANKTDTNLLVGKGWVKRAEQGYIPKAYVEPQGTLIQDLVAQGKLGRKSGEGFYKYEQKGKKSLT